MMQYLDLNVRIQKSLILDFDLASAQQSAKEDWKIDRERERIERGERMQAQSDLGGDSFEMNGEDPNGESDEEERQNDENQFRRATDKLEGIREQEDEEGANANLAEENSQLPKGDSQSRIEDAVDE